MENATKALLIAAGVLLAVMILSLVAFVYNQMSDYYQNRSNDAVKEQAEAFNKEYEAYHRDKVRGSDIISLMNKIVDYNKRYAEEQGYKKINITIDIVNNTYLNQLKYDASDIAILTSKITNTTAGKDANLTKITNIESDLIAEASVAGISLTSVQLQNLSSNISNILDDTNAKREQLLKKITGQDINVAAKLNAIKNVTKKYYQYTQYKRALFNCTDVIYDTETGRVYEMKFVVSTKTSGGNTVIDFN